MELLVLKVDLPH